MNREFLHSVFAMAQTDLKTQPFNNSGRTLRLVVEANVAAFALDVRFANFCGEGPVTIGAASIALCDEHGTLQIDTLVPLTMGGVLQFTLAPGQQLLSDTVRFALRPGCFFALNIYYPGEEKITSGNWVSNTAFRSKPGNYSVEAALPGPGLVSRFARTVTMSDMTVNVTSVCEIVAHCSTPARMVACFGDSITQQGNWTVPLEKLLYRAWPGEINLCNLGISGNRLLHDAPPAALHLGPAGMRRFERDVLALHGLTHAIIEIGTNDIGQPGGPNVPEAELVFPRQYAEGMEELAALLHRRGVKVYAATLPPRALVVPFTHERELLRQQMNEWLRQSPAFDAILDFDAILRRTDGKHGMKEGCALPDGLHPSPYGGLVIAKNIDLALFGGDGE